MVRVSILNVEKGREEDVRAYCELCDVLWYLYIVGGTRETKSINSLTK